VGSVLALGLVRLLYPGVLDAVPDPDHARAAGAVHE
jgi:hypothetical protein